LITVNDVKKDFLAPELNEIKGELKAINIRIDGIEKNLAIHFTALDQRFVDLIERLELKKRIEKLEQEAK
jgi:hypothetical protein